MNVSPLLAKTAVHVPIKSTATHVFARPALPVYAAKQIQMNVALHRVSLAHVSMASMATTVHVPLATRALAARPISMSARPCLARMVVLVSTWSMDIPVLAPLATAEHIVKSTSMNVHPIRVYLAAASMP